MTEDFYDLLEIPPDASQDEIKDAYRDQVRVYHPDLNDDDRAQAQFTAVQTAYDILGDPVERQAYDRLGHEDYVAKRTSGLPSPDVWKSDDDGDDDSSGTELSYSESETASASASTASATAGSAASGSRTGGRSSATNGSSGSGTATASAGTASSASNATASGTGAGSGGAGAGANRRTREPNAGTAGDTGRSSRSTAGSGSEADAGVGNPLARWWRRQNFSLPLLWLSVLVYAAGLGHFGLENAAALGSLWTELLATGADPAGIGTVLTEGRHGLETTVAFVRGVEFVTPPLEQPLWYGALAGLVALTLFSLLAVRVGRRETTWGPLTIDETIVVALALTVAATLVGGPLLAGAVLMPLLFGVVVRHTRRGRGWTPSYLYVLPVFAPLAGFGAVTAGYTSLPVDLVAFVGLPLVGGLWLPLRVTIMKRLGR
ncbi:J domain-containing protein [Natrinema pallidum]|uniref:Chaperone protein DnaJ n=2 Tax=Natrinema pallidum TaxID=69527 RepID=L9Z378_9EURY|nr:J domain-containing protein [Natrinema pallidum]ELY80351.1 chaperone protein DnaJ [Natrinema pallidum DSM 3751]QCW02392.1 J domain-containing protein [Natrinema pallidum]